MKSVRKRLMFPEEDVLDSLEECISKEAEKQSDKVLFSHVDGIVFRIKILIKNEISQGIF